MWLQRGRDGMDGMGNSLGWGGVEGEGLEGEGLEGGVVGDGTICFKGERPGRAEENKESQRALKPNGVQSRQRWCATECRVCSCGRQAAVHDYSRLRYLYTGYGYDTVLYCTNRYRLTVPRRRHHVLSAIPDTVYTVRQESTYCVHSTCCCIHRTDYSTGRG